jgi:hypothetical protein
MLAEADVCAKADAAAKRIPHGGSWFSCSTPFERGYIKPYWLRHALHVFLDSNGEREYNGIARQRKKKTARNAREK